MCDQQYTTVVYYTIIGLTAIGDVLYYLHLVFTVDLTAGPVTCVIYLEPYSGASQSI